MSGVLGGAAVAGAQTPGPAPVPAPAPAGCRVEGRAVSGATPLPGVSIVVQAAGAAARATSTNPAGRYQIVLAPGTYHVTASLMGFAAIDRDLVVPETPCGQTLDLTFTLLPRQAAVAPATPEAPAQGAAPESAPAAGATPETPAGRPGGARPTAPGGRGAAAGARFEALALRADAATADAEGATADEDAAAHMLLPPGFSADLATDAVAVAGDTARLDRGMMNDRMAAIERGAFDPGNVDLAPGGGPGGGGFGAGGPGRGPGMGPGMGPGGFGGPGGGFFLGGRMARQERYNGSANYGFSGSALDAAPYQLRSSEPSHVSPYGRQTFGGTFGGPVKIPGLYDGTRRTTFMVNYNGVRGDTLFDQYATVPTEAMRAGDFSTLAGQLVNPATGEPLPGNRIPAALLDPAAQALLRFIPEPNVAGALRNYHFTSTAHTAADTLNLRITQNFTPNATGGRQGGRFAGGGADGGRGGRQAAGANARGTSVLLNGQLQYRRNHSDQLNVFSTLGGDTGGSSLAVPLSLNVARGRTMHALSVNFSRTSADTTNLYAFTEDVAGAAGLAGVAADPFDWGVPNLTFASLSGVNDLNPSRRVDRRVALNYSWSHPFGRHLLRTGVNARWDTSRSQIDPNARGSFAFTGLYASGGDAIVPGSDFADFLLGLPQQASVQYRSGEVALSDRSVGLFVQDTWRTRGNLTFDLGVRYELVQPFVEQDGQLVNLDVNSAFTAVAPVVAGASGPFSGAFPRALVDTDTNNIAPRVGVAWRPKPATVLRAGYGIGYNAGSYAAIARQLATQPPFAVTSTVIGTTVDPLALATALADGTADRTTNNYGVQKDYVLGMVQTWNVDVSRDLRRVWNLGAGYMHVQGSHLDIVRAPNRGPDGLRIDGVQPFLWQTSEGSSTLNALTLRLRRRPVRGIGGGLTYTLGKARDNASSIGGATTVAQNDQDLDAEWGLSSFDRRHQLNATGQVELPFGPERRWLANGGVLAAIFGSWRASGTFTWQSGTPLTPIVRGAVSDVASGVNGALRADYDGAPIALASPTADRFFNTAAFSVPAAGAFGTAGRNIIIGPGARMLNGQVSRDLRFGGNRSFTLQVNATNLLNWVNYAAVDTVVNSPTFGQVLAVRPLRSVQVNLRMRF